MTFLQPQMSGPPQRYCSGENGRESMKSLRDAAYLHATPVSGTLALTDHCPLSCRFCYVVPGKRSECGKEFWLRLIDEALEAGCLHFLFSGGDPLIHGDFPEIYAHARRGGALATVFSSGAELPEKVLAAFADLPPTAIEISLYGASAETYERVCGSGRWFEPVCANVERLLKAGLRVRLKTMLTVETLADLDAMRNMAARLGCGFRFDGCLFPRVDGHRGPIASRLAPEAVVDEEFRDPTAVAKWRRFAAAFGGLPEDDRLFDCGAGRTAFHVDADGTLRPCLMVRSPEVSPDGAPFAERWSRLVAMVGDLKLPEKTACRLCGDRVYCGYCPGFFQLETGDACRPPDFLCRIGKLRREAVEVEEQDNLS